jgi:hypothetical protein
MADTRINALSTATVSLSDDFLPIDGTTAGTKKLSAFSPSFGGNATVGGTLTVSSTDDASNKDTGSLVLEGGLGVEKNIISGLGLSVRGAVTLPTAWTGAYGLGFEYGSAISRIFFGDGTGYSLKFVSRASSTTTDRMTLTDSGVLSVLGTTASTSTSSGALVVGNGTSGGLGVGGAGYFGDLLNISGTAGIYAQWKKTNATASSQSWTWLADNNGTLFLQAANDNFVGANSYLSFARSGVTPGTTTIHGTTASNNTSSGALVVSGGVGVAKSLNVGEAVTVAGGAFAAASFYKSASLGTVLSGATGSSYDLYITNPAGNHVMQVPTGTRNAEFAATLTTVGAITSGASISTSAPTGGSGAWELGVYSTTAPAATGYVIIEIGGTAYKLLASNV